MPPLRFGQAMPYKPPVWAVARPTASRKKKLTDAQAAFQRRVLKEKVHPVTVSPWGKVGDSIVFRNLKKKAAAAAMGQVVHLSERNLAVDDARKEELSVGGVVLSAMEEDNDEMPLVPIQPITFEQQVADGSAEHPFGIDDVDENTPPTTLFTKPKYTVSTSSSTMSSKTLVDASILHPPFILQKVDKSIDASGYLKHPPPRVSKLADLFDATLNTPLSKTDIKYLKLAGIDLERAADAWRDIQQREEHRLIALKIFQEDEARRRLAKKSKNKKDVQKGVKVPKRSKSGVLSFGYSSGDAVSVRVKLITESVLQMEKKLRRNMKDYVQKWREISTSKVPFSQIPEFRDLPWPITDGWATAPSEITKDEVKRFLFSKCNIPKTSSRTEIFNTAIGFWEPATFKRHLLRCFPGSLEVPHNIRTSAELVYSHLNELEEELEPQQAAERKRLREEEELRAIAAKKRKFVTDLWDKFTGVLRIPTSFDFNAMRAALV